MSDNNFLDINDTMVPKGLILPENKEEREINEIMKQYNTKPPIVIQPLPGICVKTKTTSGEKLFLNICVTDKIPAPEDISVTRLLDLIEEECPSFTIPMSIGNERLENDKGGSPCLTYDIALNTSYLEKCQQNKYFLVFTISVIMEGISTKFDKTLDTENYVILKNKKAMGRLQQHRIENREIQKPPEVKTPLIEEITDSSNLSNQETCKQPNSTKNIYQETITNSQCEYVILKEPRVGTIQRLIALFHMPKGIAGKDLTVLLDPDRIVVTDDTNRFIHDVSVPYNVKVEAAEALLDKDMRVLRLNMPVIVK